jgi:NADPH-dependent curcumin reductase CurA
MATVNRQWRLASRPVGDVKDENFERADAPVPEPGEGEVLVRNVYLSMDPTQRGWMARDTYLPAVKIGEVMRSFAAGRVEQSRHPKFAPGDLVSGLFGWQDYAVVPGSGPGGPAKVPPGVSLPSAMSAFGPTGLTAYFGLLDVGRPAAGETVLVSGAAGATGLVVGQIAKIKGCRAIGIAGGADKCAWLVREAGFDAAIDYKNEDVKARITELCPKGVDVYFDNVGGEILDHVLARLALRGRIVVCGAISAYSSEELPPGPKNYANLISRRGRMEGFIVLDYMSRAGEAFADLSAWAAAGKLKDRIDMQEGFENAPATLRRLFTGQNQGKQLLKIAD